MPDDVNAVATAITSVTDLVSGILQRADRDGPDKELQNDLTTIQNAFANNSMDDDPFRIFIDGLCKSTNHPLTSTGDPVYGRRELDHTLFVIAAELKYAKACLARLIASRIEK